MINHPNITEEHITTMIHKLLVAQDMNLVDHYGNRTHINWSFFNSFFFAITVTTTIGYGHLSPYTVLGTLQHIVDLELYYRIVNVISIADTIV
jgi:hypothetical protein